MKKKSAIVLVLSVLAISLFFGGVVAGFQLGFSTKTEIVMDQRLAAEDQNRFFGYAQLEPNLNLDQLKIRGLELRFGSETVYADVPCWKALNYGSKQATTLDPSGRYVCIKGYPVWEYETGNQVMVLEGPYADELALEEKTEPL